MLDYAVTEIPPEKILMGMPNYGYDWTLPFMRGTPAQSVSLTQAVDLALRYSSTSRRRRRISTTPTTELST